MPQTNLTIDDCTVGMTLKCVDETCSIYGEIVTVIGLMTKCISVMMQDNRVRTFWPKRFEIYIEPSTVLPPVVPSSKVCEDNGKRIPVHAYVDKIGIELEGGWKNGRPTIDGDVHSDGSVYCRDMGFVGEAVSNPMKHKDLLKWLKASYPGGVNESCGLHVHLSFIHPLYYQRLCDRKFWLYFYKRLTKFGEDNKAWLPYEFYRRLEGKNQYCEKKHRVMEQIYDKDKSGARYAQLNYCLSLHGTLEIRVLPMFIKPEQALIAINELINVVVSYLAKCKREEALTGEDIADIPETTEDVLTEDVKINSKDFLVLS